jgi:ribosomal protein L6P/L9E
MSRVASNPVTLPKGVEVTINDGAVKVKGAKGELALALTDGIQANQEDGSIVFTYSSDGVKAMAGTTRALVSNMVKGVSEGWEKKLVLNGVGYRAKASGNTVNLTVGLSHPVDFELPRGSVPKRRRRRRSWSRVWTSRLWARWQRRFAASGRRSRTRARVSATRTSTSVVRKPRRSRT